MLTIVLWCSIRCYAEVYSWVLYENVLCTNGSNVLTGITSWCTNVCWLLSLGVIMGVMLRCTNGVIKMYQQVLHQGVLMGVM